MTTKWLIKCDGYRPNFWRLLWIDGNRVYEIGSYPTRSLAREAKNAHERDEARAFGNTEYA